MLPTASAERRAARSRWQASEVVVVLPLVPVTAIQRSGERRQANSGSPMICPAWSRAEAKKAENSEMPGLATHTSKEPSTSSLPRTTVAPASSSAREASEGRAEAPP